MKSLAFLAMATLLIGRFVAVAVVDSARLNHGDCVGPTTIYEEDTTGC
jgi:hypothetical protein